jgi:hypothetical protein
MLKLKKYVKNMVKLAKYSKKNIGNKVNLLTVLLTKIFG